MFKKKHDVTLSLYDKDRLDTEMRLQIAKTHGWATMLAQMNSKDPELDGIVMAMGELEFADGSSNTVDVECEILFLPESLAPKSKAIFDQSSSLHKKIFRSFRAAVGETLTQILKEEVDRLTSDSKGV